MDAQTYDHIRARARQIALSLPPLSEHQRDIVRRSLARSGPVRRPEEAVHVRR